MFNHAYSIFPVIAAEPFPSVSSGISSGRVLRHPYLETGPRREHNRRWVPERPKKCRSRASASPGYAVSGKP